MVQVEGRTHLMFIENLLLKLFIEMIAHIKSVPITAYTAANKINK